MMPPPTGISSVVARAWGLGPLSFFGFRLGGDLLGVGLVESGGRGLGGSWLRALLAAASRQRGRDAERRQPLEDDAPRGALLAHPGLTLSTRHPWCGQTALKALNSPGAGWVTTSCCSRKTVPLPSGTSALDPTT